MKLLPLGEKTLEIQLTLSNHYQYVAISLLPQYNIADYKFHDIYQQIL